MSRKVKTLITFKIRSTFDKTVKTDEIKQLYISNYEFNINALFGENIENDSKKVISLHQDPKDNIKKFSQANSKVIKSHKVNFSTIEESF